MGLSVLAVFCGVLRIVKLDILGLMECFEDTRQCDVIFVPLALLGKFKGETGSRYHIINIAWDAYSGLKVGK